MDSEWKRKAACRGKPTEWWYETGGPGRPAQGAKSYLKARPVCGECKVRAECLQESRDTEVLADLRVRVPVHGMRAGLTPFERYKIFSKAKKYDGKTWEEVRESRLSAQQRSNYAKHEAAIRRVQVAKERYRLEKPA